MFELNIRLCKLQRSATHAQCIAHTYGMAGSNIVLNCIRNSVGKPEFIASANQQPHSLARTDAHTWYCPKINRGSSFCLVSISVNKSIKMALNVSMFAILHASIAVKRAAFNDKMDMLIAPLVATQRLLLWLMPIVRVKNYSNHIFNFIGEFFFWSW